MNHLQMRCVTCKIAESCSANGSSPLVLPSKKHLLCTIFNGYSRAPADESILSEESRAAAKKDGPCMSIAEVPSIDPDSGMVFYKLVKIFHEPILHEREKTSFIQDQWYPKSHN